MVSHRMISRNLDGYVVCDGEKGKIPFNRKKKNVILSVDTVLCRFLLLQTNNWKYSLVKVWEP